MTQGPLISMALGWDLAVWCNFFIFSQKDVGEQIKADRECSDSLGHGVWSRGGGMALSVNKLYGR